MFTKGDRSCIIVPGMSMLVLLYVRSGAANHVFE